MRHPVEQECVDDHGRDGLCNDPEDAEQRLTIANLQVAPDEGVKELPEAPELAKVDGSPTARRFDLQDGDVNAFGVNV